MIKRESQEIQESTTCEVGHTNLCPVTKKCFMDWFRREHNYNISMPQQQQKNKKKKIHFISEYQSLQTLFKICFTHQ